MLESNLTTVAITKACVCKHTAQKESLRFFEISKDQRNFGKL